MDKVQRNLYENKQQQMAMFGSWVLRGHGITKAAFDTLPPLPEKYYEPGPLNTGLREENSDLFEPHTFSTERSSSTLGHFSQSWSDIEENFTERSSVFSWRHDDEFDRRAASQVRKIFLDVDSCLYESMETKLSSDLNSECSEWNTSFPYLRLIGTQLLPSNDSGTQIIEVHSDKDNLHTPHNSNKDCISESMMDILLVNGSKVEAKAAPLDESTFTYLEEEVFATDGDMEEFIAYDQSNIDDPNRDSEEKNYGKEAIPPVTPFASIHDRIVSECFDKVWNKLIYVLADLIKLYAKTKARKGSNNLSNYYDEEQFVDVDTEIPVSRESRQLPSRSLMHLKTSSGLASSSSLGLQDLKELMTIRSLPLQERLAFPTILREDDHVVNDHAVSREVVVNRPVSSSVGVYRQFPKSSTFRNAEQQFYDRMVSAKTANKRAVRLQPLSLSKTAGSLSAQENASLSEVRGKSLQTPGDRQSMCQYWNSRIVTLPPLERLNTNEMPIGRLRSSKRSMRVSSAATNHKTAETHERTTFAVQDSRPNTMYSLRTDMLFNKYKSSGSLFHNNRSTIHDHYPTMTKTFEDENSLEFNTFVLWGHGPPLISSQKKSRNGNR